MLKMLMERAAERCPQDLATSGFMAAFGVLADLQADYPAAVDRLLAYPGTGAWLGHCLRRIACAPADASPPLWADLGYLGWLAATALAEAGPRADVSVPVVIHSGNVMLPACGLALTGVTDSGVGAFRWTGDGRFEIAFRGSRLAVATREDHAVSASWLPLRRIALAHGDAACVLLDDADPFLTAIIHRADRGRLATQRWFTERPPWQSLFDAATNLLDEYCPERSGPIFAWLRTVQPAASRGPRQAASETSPESFGSLATSVPHDPGDLARTLVHECQHAVLGAALDCVTLTVPTQQRWFYAPWTGTMRPAAMLLQGAYAHVGVAEFWDGYRQSAASRSERQFADAEHQRLQSQLRWSFAQLLSSDMLTPEGELFLSRLQAPLVAAGVRVPTIGQE